MTNVHLAGETLIQPSRQGSVLLAMVGPNRVESRFSVLLGGYGTIVSTWAMESLDS